MIKMKAEMPELIGKHGEATYPEECCGILLGFDDGSTRVITEVAALDNRQDENRRRRFLVTPSQYLWAERTASERRLQLLGFYHSHPDHPAAPSEFDRDHALPWFTYVILSVERGKASKLRGWTLSETRERFDETWLSKEPPLIRETRAATSSDRQDS
jgi:proteasome lid subunit RPN8/RPN11